MFGLWEWLQRNYGPVAALTGIGTFLLSFVLVLLTGAWILLQNPHLIDPLVNVADAVLPASASTIVDGAVIVLAALAGAQFMRLVWLLVRVRSIPKRSRVRRASRRFALLHGAIARCNRLVLELEDRQGDETDSAYSSRRIGTLAELDALGKNLKQLNIGIPKPIDDDLSNLEDWRIMLDGIEKYARDGDYQQAVEITETYVRLVLKDT